MKVGHNPLWCPYRKRKSGHRYRGTQGEGHLKTEAEIRGMLPQAKDPERAGRGNETFSLEPLEVV